MTGARGATSCMICCAQDHSIVALIALNTINNLLEMMIIQVNDEQRFSDRNSSELLLHLYHSMVRVTYSTSYYSDEVWLQKMMQLIVMVMLMI
jgi:hypothetical protein